MILNEKDHKAKEFQSKTGKIFGGAKFRNANIQRILKSVIYTGKVHYNGEVFSGMHEAIISDETFNKVQEIIKYNRVERPDFKNKANPGILNNLLHCKACDSSMFHTYTSKKGRLKYQYYVCVNAQKRGYKNCPSKSVNATQLENAVVMSLLKIAADAELRKKPLDHELKEALLFLKSPIWETLFPAQKNRTLKLMLKKVDYNATDGTIELTLNHNGIKFLYLLLHPELQKKLT